MEINYLFWFFCILVLKILVGQEIEYSILYTIYIPHSLHIVWARSENLAYRHKPCNTCTDAILKRRVIYEDFKKETTNSFPQLITRSPLISKTFWCCTVIWIFVASSVRHLTSAVPLSRELSVSGRIRNICAREAKNHDERDWRGRNGSFANVREGGGWPPGWTWLQSRYTLLASPYRRRRTFGFQFSKDKMQMQQ